MAAPIPFACGHELHNHVLECLVKTLIKTIGLDAVNEYYGSMSKTYTSPSPKHCNKVLLFSTVYIYSYVEQT